MDHLEKLNESISDEYVKCILQSMILQLNHSQTDSIATKSQVEQNPTKVSEFFSQESVEMSLTGEKADGREFSQSLTSLVLRVPGFDQIEHNGYSFIKMFSPDIILGESKIEGNDDKGLVLKIPTDDERVMLCLIPYQFISNSQTSID